MRPVKNVSQTLAHLLGIGFSGGLIHITVVSI